MANEHTPAAQNKIAELHALSSVLLERAQFMRQAGITFKGMRDLYEILGYDRKLVARDFHDRYQRGGIAGRIIDALPNATWRGGWELVEDDDPNKETEFEKTWNELNNRVKIGPQLRKVDILAGQGRYAVLLLGVRGDGSALSQELPKGKPADLLFLTPFGEVDAQITQWEVDPTNERFGQPMMYQLSRLDFTASAFNTAVHWSRVIHIAEDTLDNEAYGAPTLERVWNLLDDLDKVTGGGAEAFWLRANQGLHLNLDKDMNISPEEKEALRTSADEYQHQMRRMLRTRGVEINPLGSDVANFEGPADAILTQIAGAKAIPKRILTGSEMGELASSQDRDNWRDQINGRQTAYAGPFIVQPLVDRLISFGYLPKPKEYRVHWAQMQVLTESERSTGAKDWASVNSTMGHTTFTTAELRDKWYGMPPLTEEQLAEEDKLKPEPPALEPGAPAPGQPSQEDVDAELEAEKAQEKEDEEKAKRNKLKAASGPLLTSSDLIALEQLEEAATSGRLLNCTELADGSFDVEVEDEPSAQPIAVLSAPTTSNLPPNVTVNLATPPAPDVTVQMPQRKVVKKTVVYKELDGRMRPDHIIEEEQ